MNSELAEEYGAGFEGTKELLYKYLKDTPGQKIVKYMDKTNKELEESITADNVEKITGAQIEKYIDAQNFKALDQISKFLSADEYELWSKNGFEGRTFELLMKKRAKNVKEAVEKIACLKCDEVSTAAAWQKNKGFCPTCKTSSQGVAESTEFDKEIKLFESDDSEPLNEELFTTLAGYYLALKMLPLATAAVLIAFAGVVKTIDFALKGSAAVNDALKKAKGKPISAKKAEVLKRLEKFQDMMGKKPEKVGLIKKAATTLLSKIKKKVSSDKKEEVELQEMQELFAVVDENDVVLATASNELAAKRSISSSELPPLSVKDKSKLRIVKTRKTAQVGAPLKEQVDLQTLRTMKIVSLATGCTDSAALYEYALTAPTYTSLVELKENFNRYLQDA